MKRPCVEAVMGCDFSSESLGLSVRATNPPWLLVSELFLLVWGSPRGLVRCGKLPSLVRRLKFLGEKIL